MASALTTYLCTVTQKTQSDTFDFFMDEMYSKIPSNREVLDIVGNLSTGAKIFETEQANLYLEAVVNVKIFAKCLSSTILQIMDQIVDISQIREAMETLFNKIVQQAKTTLKILSILKSTVGNVQKIEWIGGWSYQSQVFVYMFNSLSLVAEINETVARIRSSDSGSFKVFMIQLQSQSRMNEDVISKLRDMYTYETGVDPTAKSGETIMIHPWIRECIHRCISS